MSKHKKNTFKKNIDFDLNDLENMDIKKDSFLFSFFMKHKKIVLYIMLFILLYIFDLIATFYLLLK